MLDSCQPVLEVSRRRYIRPGFERRTELVAPPGNRLNGKLRVDVQGRAADSTGFLDFALLKVRGREVDTGKCLVTRGTLGSGGGLIAGDDQRRVLLGLGRVLQPGIAGAGVEGEVGLLEPEDGVCLGFTSQAAERTVGTVQASSVPRRSPSRAAARASWAGRRTLAMVLLVANACPARASSRASRGRPVYSAIMLWVPRTHPPSAW